jgi:hypothetical protein
MTRGQGHTKECERRQKAVEHEAAMEAKQAGTSATARVGRRRKSLTRRSCRSSMTEGRRSPILPFCGTLRTGLATPAGATGPISPLGPAVGGPPTLLHPMGVRDSVTAIDDRSRIG